MRRNATLWIAVAVVVATTALTACSASGRDTEITTRVKTVLQADRVVDASKIQVTTEAGVVTLEGSVAGEPAHGKAIELAQNVEGVRLVRDRLDVTPAPPAPAYAEPPDSSPGRSAPPSLGGMTVENRRRSRRPASQPGGSYGMLAAVVGPQGDVSLAPGSEPSIEPVSRREAVPGPEPREAAVSAATARGDEPIAAALPDSPVPFGPSDAEDASITARVQAGLVDLGHRVQVLTRAGVVILSGVVDTELERSQALRIARATKGVARVEDRLVVLVT
jgi:osmotically-inducible protein OsmY